VRRIAGLLIGCIVLLGTIGSATAADAAASNRRAPEPTPTPRESEGVRGTAVTMEAVEFTPARLIVKVGETVTWTNKDPYPHNVKSSDGAFESGEIAPDAQWQYRATAAGRFPYTCTLHPGMDGILIVEP
jgi:plastocyanin